MILGDYRQGKKKEKKQTHPVGLGHHTGYRSAILTGRSEWVINTAKHYSQNDDPGEKR
jgi:hypothetical protein